MATRGALVYFLVDALCALDRVYHYSMANFVAAMHKGARSALAMPHSHACPDFKCES